MSGSVRGQEVGALAPYWRAPGASTPFTSAEEFVMVTKSGQG